MQEIVAGEGHGVLVANPRLMEGSKRRKHKSHQLFDSATGFALSRIIYNNLESDGSQGPMDLCMPRASVCNRGSLRRGVE